MTEFLQKILDAQLKMQTSVYPEVKKLPQEEQMLINTRAMIH